MRSKGDCFDNAVAESFFATLEKDPLRRRSLPTRQDVRTAVFAYVEGFYNPIRLHSPGPKERCFDASRRGAIYSRPHRSTSTTSVRQAAERVAME
jgi:transposase InsO family protein